MAKINTETLLRGDGLLLQEMQQLFFKWPSPTTSLFVPLPLPAPGSAPVYDDKTIKLNACSTTKT